MRIAMNSIVIGAVAAAMIWNAGCKSATQRQFEAERVVIAPPMEHDPTDRIELSRWWSNGTHLLRLDSDAGYALFEGQNRFATPRERGRWSRQSYAALWLEPYNTRNVEPRRVGITKRDGRLTLLVPNLDPMVAVQSPPAAPEDRVVGTWTGPLGALHLWENLRYTFHPPGGPTDELASQQSIHSRGTWRVRGNELLLQPDTPGYEPFHLLLIDAQDGDGAGDEADLKIEAPGGSVLQRSADRGPISAWLRF